MIDLMSFASFLFASAQTPRSVLHQDTADKKGKITTRLMHNADRIYQELLKFSSKARQMSSRSRL